VDDPNAAKVATPALGEEVGQLALRLDLDQAMQIQFCLDVPFPTAKSAEHLPVDAGTHVGHITLEIGVFDPVQRVLQGFEDDVALVSQQALGNGRDVRRGGERAAVR
jgi:hypothetical protein